MSNPAEPRVVMYTTPGCPYCVGARRLLEREGISFVDHDVSRDWDLREKISRETRWRTVPMIFLDGKFVGGFDDLSALKARGGLTAAG